MHKIEITDIDGFKIGHAQNIKAATGVTVILAPGGVTAGVDVRGGAPGTRETDLLAPVNMVEKIHAVMLAGGSAFGLDAAAGIMAYLEEKQIGFDAGFTRIPIVCGAVLFDLAIGDFRIRPDKQMGYRACKNAEIPSTAQGNVGAGTGATVGKILGMERAMKSGLGLHAVRVDDLQVGALAAVNCLGDVYDPGNGKKYAGVLEKDGSMADTDTVYIGTLKQSANLFAGNTTIGAVLTNADFTKAQVTKLASMAHTGYARTMRPAFTMYDGDTIFTMCSGQTKADLTLTGMLAAHVMEKAVVSAVKSTASLCGLKCAADIK